MPGAGYHAARQGTFAERPSLVGASVVERPIAIIGASDTNRTTVDGEGSHLAYIELGIRNRVPIKCQDSV